MIRSVTQIRSMIRTVSFVIRCTTKCNTYFFSKINVYYVQTNYNDVAVLHQGAGKETGARKFVKKVNIHMGDIEMSGKMKRLKRKMEVQKITFNYFA